MVRIAVSDTGRGMSKSELDRAFDDFLHDESQWDGARPVDCEAVW